MSDDELEPLITECPGCHTRFRVVEAQLQRAGGKVRCGACLTVFHGIEHLTFESAQAYASDEHAQQALDALLDELADPAPAGNEADAAQHTASDRDDGRSDDSRPSRQRPRGPIFSGFEEPDDADEGRPQGVDRYAFQVMGGDAPGQGEEADAGAADGSRPDTAAPDQPQPEPGDDKSVGAAEPDDDQPPQTVSTSREGAGAAAVAAEPLPAAQRSEPVVFGEVYKRQPLVWLGIAVGLVLLAAQVLWYQFDDWAKDPQWRGVYASLCQVLGCRLPQQRDQNLLTTRNLAVRSHPERADTLLVNAVIVNEAEFAQPFPVLELRFTTVRGILVAGRRFEPEQYLAGDAEGMQLIPPRTPVQVALTIDDPGPEAVNYFLRFR